MVMIWIKKSGWSEYIFNEMHYNSFVPQVFCSFGEDLD